MRVVWIFFWLQKKIRERWGERGHNVFVPGDEQPLFLVWTFEAPQLCQQREETFAQRRTPLRQIKPAPLVISGHSMKGSP